MLNIGKDGADFNSLEILFHLEGAENNIVEYLTVSGMVEVDLTYDEFNNDGNKPIGYLYYNTYIILVYILEYLRVSK